MGQVNPSDVARQLRTGLKTTFFDQYKTVPTVFEQFTTIVPSDSDQEDYGWLGEAPDMREWTDERIPKGLAAFNYTIRNKKFENSIRVKAETFEDEKYGQVKSRVQQLADKAARFPNKLVSQLVEAGFTSLAYDGQYFFDTDHSEGASGTQSNKGTTALRDDSLNTAIATMQAYKDDQGELVGVNPTHLMVPPALKQTAKKLLNAEKIIHNGDTEETYNELQGELELIVNPYLTDTNNWYVLDLSGFLKPFLYQKRTDVKFDQLDSGSKSDRAFMTDEFLYGTRIRGNAGYGNWRLAYGALVA